ncbi:MAG TPA: STAS domain-containing protein [Spirochaetota bacterium]|nr:STAS domain-containing protein [Spirochaetota bacterium]
MSSVVDILIDEPKPGILVIYIKGQYSLETLELIETHLTDAFSRKPGLVAINCSETSYIDSTGLGSLVKYYNTALRNDVTFILYDINREIQRIIDIAGLGKFFNIQTQEQFQSTYLQH